MRRRIAALAVLAGATSLVAAGCGSSSNADSTSSATSSTAAAPADTTASTSNAAGGDAAVVKEAQAEVARLYKSTNRPPSGAPVPAKPGMKIAVVSCGQAVPSCSVPAAEALKAAKALGWEGTLYDAELTPSKVGPLIDQALAHGVKGIAVVGLDCSLGPAGFARAKAAGVQVADVFGSDNCEPGTTDFTPVKFADYDTGEKYFNGWARAHAQYLIAKTNGQAKVLSFDLTDIPVNHAQALAFADEMRKCSGCKVYTVPWSAQDFGPKLQQIAQQAPLKHPDANSAYIISDAHQLGGIQAGLAASGKQLTTIGGEGSPPTFQLLAAGKLTALMPYSSTWAGWALIDTLNSLFAGQPVRNSGIGWQLADKAHDPADAQGNYQPSVDYESAYKKLWGIG